MNTSLGSESFSSCSQTKPKVTKLVHTWHIDHFSLHCEKKISERDYIDASKFSPYKFDQAQLRFFLRLHPLGDKENLEETKDHVPLYLHMESNQSEGVLVHVKLSIVNDKSAKLYSKGLF